MVFNLLHVGSVVVNADAPHIKMVSEQYDRCHGILLQYVEFLTSAVSPVTAYAHLIPPLEDLVHKYHIEPEVFQILPLHLSITFRGLGGTEIRACHVKHRSLS